MGSLPPALRELGDEVVSILPLYQSVERESGELAPLTTVEVPFDGDVFPTRIFEAGYPDSACRALFIENEEYFGRPGIYTDPATGEPYEDDDRRWFFFQLAVLELLRQAEIVPDLLVVADWQTALLPALLRTQLKEDQLLKEVRTVLSLHNLGYQGLFPPSSIARIGLPEELMFALSPFEYYDKLNCLKAGLSFADHIVTVSPNYASQITTPEYGHGLDGVLRQRSEHLSGIINGVDAALWNPARDPLIDVQYSLQRLNRKRENRNALSMQYRVSIPEGCPVIGMVSRLTDQKGLNILAGCIDRLLARNLRMFILGTGEKQFENFLTDVAERHPDRLGVKIGYSEALAHQIFAGADMFLMPSRYEPCGLSQMYSMLYGTVPVVHWTGGLRDTVLPFMDKPEAATGFTFTEYNAEALLNTVDIALKAWGKPRSWRKIQRNGMKQDFSWKRSAKEYHKLFGKVVSRPRWGENIDN